MLAPFLCCFAAVTNKFLRTFDLGWLPWMMESSLYIFNNAVEVGYVIFCFQFFRYIDFCRHCLSSHKTHSLENTFCLGASKLMR